MSERVKTLVALDAGVERETVQSGAPGGPDDPGRRPRRRSRGELDRAPGDPDRPARDRLRRLLRTDARLHRRRGQAAGRPPGRRALRRARRTASSGASSRPAPTTSSRCRSTPERASCSRSRRRSRASSGASVAAGAALAPMICVLGPKGGTGKTLTTSTSASPGAGRAHGRDRRSRPPVRRRRARARALARDDDLRPRQVRRLAGRREARGYLVEHASGVRVLLAPTRPDQASCVTVEFLREVSTRRCGARSTTSSSTRRPGSRPR